MDVDREIDRNTAWALLDEAASCGQLEEVNLVARYVSRNGDAEEQCSNSKAVSLAIAGGHAEVAAYLLRYPWNMAFYFMEAMEKGQHAVAKKVYLMYPLNIDGKNLIVDVLEMDSHAQPCTCIHGATVAKS
ncbi:hypothetical protein PI126_g8955 [Phytophthora idaei]|nr:hypothetical protein PI126_g8955 [Phytophthora idaei]